MLDAFVIFSTTGVVHFLYSPIPLSPSALSLSSSLVESILIDSRGSLSANSRKTATVALEEHALEYAITQDPAPEAARRSERTVYLAIYPKLLRGKVPYVPALIEACGLAVAKVRVVVAGQATT